jgi:DNA-binding CsgD family transcriptional regulator
MEAWVLVLKKAHLKTGDDVKLPKCDLEIFWLLAQGLDNAAIGDELCMSVNTVTHHLTPLFKSTGARNRTELTLFGIDNKLVKKTDGVYIKNWETDDIAWVWEKRKYGEMRSEE